MVTCGTTFQGKYLFCKIRPKKIQHDFISDLSYSWPPLRESLLVSSSDCLSACDREASGAAPSLSCVCLLGFQIRNECLTCRNAVAVFDMSYFGKFYLVGPEARKAADWLFTADVSKPPGRAARKSFPVAPGRLCPLLWGLDCSTVSSQAMRRRASGSAS